MPHAAMVIPLWSEHYCYVGNQSPPAFRPPPWTRCSVSLDTCSFGVREVSTARDETALQQAMNHCQRFTEYYLPSIVCRTTLFLHDALIDSAIPLFPVGSIRVVVYLNFSVSVSRCVRLMPFVPPAPLRSIQKTRIERPIVGGVFY